MPSNTDACLAIRLLNHGREQMTFVSLHELAAGCVHPVLRAHEATLESRTIA